MQLPETQTSSLRHSLSRKQVGSRSQRDSSPFNSQVVPKGQSVSTPQEGTQAPSVAAVWTRQNSSWGQSISTKQPGSQTPSAAHTKRTGHSERFCEQRVGVHSSVVSLHVSPTPHPSREQMESGSQNPVSALQFCALGHANVSVQGSCSAMQMFCSKSQISDTGQSEFASHFSIPNSQTPASEQNCPNGQGTSSQVIVGLHPSKLKKIKMSA